ncbi:Flagellar M-ring protein [Buchnera aphidicola (Cinara kochiana kochiana)]|uniref:Flagellar M-ring protein n=1 Tax=Buchnera aphidicola (Cinara kochiana kochiana) TaxID=2518976 RepID=A0A451D5C7_9GAMM|nr:flagellar basal-body MS-ring/collar protein FliF [Buchnera aphidicola]VFP80965.1 Flagellar M-ring protein [Buchnera aphidicola (Cinara kochiana kochiana)]
MDIINILFSKIKKYWYYFLNYISHRLKFIIFTVCVIFFTICTIFFWFNRVNYVVLYDNLSDVDGQWITSKLQDMDIPYQFCNSYKTLLVPKDKVNELHFSLLNNQDIKKKTDGFELLDKEKFGISQFHEHINYNRGLEGELSKTLENIFPIQHARVHLVCKQDTDFFRDIHVIPSASIILTLFPNTQLSSEQIDAITLLVSGSIPDLSADHIVVVNQLGNILNKFTLNHGKFFKTNQYTKINILEQYFADHIAELLVPIYGSKNVMVRVTAGVDPNNDNAHNPNIDHLKETSDSKKKLGNISNIIPHKNQHDNLKNSLTQSFLKSSSLNFFSKSFITKYLVNNFLLNQQFICVDHSIVSHKMKSVDNTKKNLNDSNTMYFNDTVFFPGFRNSDIRHLKITVLINYKKNDVGTFLPLSAHELKNIEKLVKSVINFSDSRGDCINIINSMFTTSDAYLYNKDGCMHMNLNLYSLLVILLVILIIILFFFLFIKDNRINDNKKNFLKASTNIDEISKNNFNKNINKLNLKKHNTLNEGNFFVKNNFLNKNPKIVEKIIRYWINKK